MTKSSIIKERKEVQIKIKRLKYSLTGLDLQKMLSRLNKQTLLERVRLDICKYQVRININNTKTALVQDIVLSLLKGLSNLVEAMVLKKVKCNIPEDNKVPNNLK
jgi:hypothetical protein